MKREREPLGAWKAALRGIATDLVLPVAAMADRLSLFFGPYPLPRSGRNGEPQGYFGLSNQGPYERLLASEWALLEAAPLEFQRRAIAGEQLFFALAQNEPAGGRRCVALVDAGPGQLGNCRLAQLALLLVLAERAKAAGALFLWSSWQADPGDLGEGFEAGSLRRFLEQRTHRPAAPEQVEAWLALIGQASAEEERWSIGAAFAERPGAGFQQVALREDEGSIVCRAVTVEWRRHGRQSLSSGHQHSLSLELPLPSEVERIRLLKNPYQQRPERSQAKKQENPNRGLQLENSIESVTFACRDERLLVRTATELKMVMAGGPKLDQQPGRPRSFRFEEGEKLVAAGSVEALMTVVLRREDQLCFHRVTKGRERDNHPVTVRSVHGIPSSRHGGGVCVPDPGQPRERWFFQDGNRVVHVYNFHEKRFESSLDEVDALFASRGSSVEAVRALRYPEHLRFHGGDWKTVWSCDGASWSRAFAGAGGAMAFELADNVWVVDARKLRPDARCEVVGVARTKGSKLAGLLLLGSEKLELYHEGLSFRRLLAKAPSAIQGVAVGVQQSLLAYWTASGGLEILPRRRQEPHPARGEVLKALRGRWPVAALFWESGLVAEAEAGRRAIAAWSRGSRFLAFDEGWLLVFPEPRSLRVERAGGAPLLAAGSRLLSHPRQAEELAALPPDAVLLWRGGGWICLRQSEGRTGDPAAFLDLESSLRIAGRSLGLPPVAPALVLDPPAREARQALGVGEADPEAAEFLRRVGGKRAPAKPGFWARIFEWLRGRASKVKKAGGSQAGAGTAAAGPDAAEPAQSGWAGLARLASQLGIWHWAAFRHVQFLRSLIRALDDLDFDVALRKAIPLSNSPHDGDTPGLSAPEERAHLRVTSGRGSAGGVSFGSDFFRELNARYRRMAQELERRGQIDKAAFVWAELLGFPEEAVTLLEKHRLYAQAAEIAEIRSLGPATAARLHLLAGNAERAVNLAAAFDVFGPVVAMLESRESGGPGALLLRRLWAVRLARSGDFAAAVGAIWPVEAARGAALDYIEQGLAAAHGFARGELLVRLLQAAPERSAEVLREWRLLLAAGDGDEFDRRRALAELVVADTGGTLAPLARATLRAMLEDGGGSELRRLYVQLAAGAADPVLAEEARLLILPPRPAEGAGLPLRYRAEIAGGGLEIRDLVVLPGNRLLAASGENGVYLLGPDGKVEHCFAEPADRLVAPDRGDWVVAISRPHGWLPGRHARLARLNLRHRAGGLWLHDDFEAVAPDFDGQRLLVARRQTLEILDVLTGEKILWRMPNLDGRVDLIRRSADHTAFTTRSPLRIWRLDRGLVLRAKDDLELLPQLADLFFEDGRAWDLVDLDSSGLCAVADQIGSRLRFFRSEKEEGVPLPTSGRTTASLQGPYAVAVVEQEGIPCCRVRLATDLLRSNIELAVIEGPGWKNMKARIFGRILALFDAEGRYLLADLRSGRVRLLGRFHG